MVYADRRARFVRGIARYDVQRGNGRYNGRWLAK